ncbi:hypothetical protein G6F61_014511 [Rhizopus arrhizus]|nr:hypothetical protein G6F61_014511 [Rhizopus arrhizus]
MAQQHDHRIEAGTALAVGLFSHRVQQLGVVGRGIGRLAGIARAVQARCTAEGIDDQARIIGQRRQAGRFAGRARLQQRVLDEGQAGLFHVAQAQLGGRGDLQRQVGEDLLHLHKLDGVVAGQYQFLH